MSTTLPAHRPFSPAPLRHRGPMPGPLPRGLAPCGETAAQPVSDIVSLAPAGSVHASMDATRAALGELSFPALDPFAASVAATMWSRQHGAFRGDVVDVALPGALGKALPVEVCFKNGRGAPMLIILPGVGGDSEAAHVRMLAQQALHHGMNYTVLPNSWSDTWLTHAPERDPGNLPWESRIIRNLLDVLRERYPEHYDQVSVVGYSYGALLGAAVIAEPSDDDAPPPVINGGFVAISPPENLLHSMKELDDLRHQYEDGDGWPGIAARYAAWVAYYGYERVLESPIATRTDHDVEKFLADTQASRRHLQKSVEYVDASDGWNLLPLHRALAQEGPDLSWKRRRELRAEQDRALTDATFTDYANTYVANDLMPGGSDSTMARMAEQYRFSRLLAQASGQGVPVVTLTSADDYILNPSNVAAFREMQSHPAPDQATRVLEHGGHVGLLFSPQAREQLMGFLAHPPSTAA